MKHSTSHVSVFAGLGSAAVFSNSSRNTALKDFERVEARILLQACHQIFLKEIDLLGVQSPTIGIRLEHFQKPASLLDPPLRYQQNAVIQSTTLCLVQLLRYLSVAFTSLSECQNANLGIAGFCSGLLPAVAVATSPDLPSFLIRGEESFTVSLWIGIRTEQFKRKQDICRAVGQDAELPWAVVVNDIEASQAERLILEQGNHDDSQSKIHITAKNSELCVTLSGRGDHLQEFCSKMLPDCKIRPTCLYTLFHAGDVLRNVKQQILLDLSRRCCKFASFTDLKEPLYSTIDGKAIQSPRADRAKTLLEDILDMILIYPVDWISVQDQIFADIKGFLSISENSVSVLHFGPGYGISKSRYRSVPQIKFIDASVFAGNMIPEEANTFSAQDDIAIVGMAVNLPGASDTAQLWNILAEGINTVADIPPSRFHIEDYYKGNGRKGNTLNGERSKRSMNTNKGNFIDSPFQFDPVFFNISPREAKTMDPQQRVLLQTAYHALENAGFVPDATPSFTTENFGCYIGAATLDYVENLRDEIDVYYSTGTLRAFMSGQLSYTFKFSGPSLTLDTACSSSMVALYQACRAILSGDCQAAIAGGVNIITSPDMYLGLDRAHFLSPTGQCKPFDASADGYCRSEGCGLFVLKKLSDAIGENDRILGVIKGIEINQSGHAHSITHPHSQTQERLFQRLLSKAKVNPRMISVVEAHGTGTKAGDKSECTSIRKILCKNRTYRDVLHITSIKANIGHCEAASGAAGLAKLLLMIQKKMIPRQISLETLSPSISTLHVDGASISKSDAPWTTKDAYPRTALLNNFGAAGSNGALIVQEHLPIATEHLNLPKKRCDYVFGCSAKTSEALSTMRLKLLNHFRSNRERVSLGDICYTSTARRQVYDHRISFPVCSVESLIGSLENAVPLNFRVTESKSAPVLVFSGQGSQYMGMGKDLFHTSPIFRDTVLECDNFLVESGFPGVMSIIDSSDPDSFDDETTKNQAFQSSLFVFEVGLAKLWMSWGIRPAAVVGHSLGEYAALVIAGVLELKDALKIVANRARLMMQLCESGITGMLAINASYSTVLTLIQSTPTFSKLTISCYNSPVDCVVAGSLRSLSIFQEALKAQMLCKCKLLDVPMAYHSEAMNPVVAPLLDITQKMKFAPPRIPLVSNVLGRTIAVGDAAFTPDYFGRHCTQPVAFEQGLEDLTANYLSRPDVAPKWIEVGPHPSVLPMIKAKLKPETVDCIPSMRKKVDSWKTLSEGLSIFYLSNLDVNWREVFNGFETPQCVELPSYPFKKEQYYIEYPREEPKKALGEAVISQPSTTGYSFLSEFIQRPSSDNGNSAIFETPIEILEGSITGHVVCGQALCPASVYHEIIIAAVTILQSSKAVRNDPIGFPSTEMLSNVTYTQPLLYQKGSKKTVKAVIKDWTAGNLRKEFFVYSYDSTTLDREALHCHGFIKLCSILDRALKFARSESRIQKGKENIFKSEEGRAPQTFYTKALYERIFTRVVTYSQMYQSVLSITIDCNESEAYATVQLPADKVCPTQKFAAHPVFIDTLLHVAGFVANFSINKDFACICKSVKSMQVLYDRIKANETYGIYCSNLFIADENLILADAYAIDSQAHIVARFKGMQFTCVRLTSLEALLNSVAGEKPRTTIKQTQVADYTESDTKRVSSNEVSVLASVEARDPAAEVVPSQPTVAAIIAETCGVSTVAVSGDMTLEALGIDSLMFYELEALLKSHYPKIELSLSELEACKTVKDVEHLVSLNCDTRSPLQSQSILNSAVTKLQDNIHLVKHKLNINQEDMMQSTNSSRTSYTPATDIFTVTSEEPTIDEEKEIMEFLKMNQHPALIQDYRKAVDGTPAYPLFLIHDGSGVCTKYHNLEPLHRSVWGIHNPRFFSAEPWDSLSSVAESYADCICTTTEGPYLLGGWSFGGVVAFEAARQLLKRNLSVAGVVLIDSPAPVNHQPITSEIVEDVLKAPGMTSQNNTRSKILDLIRGQFHTNATALAAFRPEIGCTTAQVNNPNLILLHSREGFDLSHISPTAVNPWLERRSSSSVGAGSAAAAARGWEYIMGGEKVPVVDIPGNHFEPFERKNIKEVSQKVREACAQLQESYEAGRESQRAGKEN